MRYLSGYSGRKKAYIKGLYLNKIHDQLNTQGYTWDKFLFILMGSVSYVNKLIYSSTNAHSRLLHWSSVEARGWRSTCGGATQGKPRGCRPCGRLPGGEERAAGDHCCLAGTGPWSNTWALAGQVRWAEHMKVKS